MRKWIGLGVIALGGVTGTALYGMQSSGTLIDGLIGALPALLGAFGNMLASQEIYTDSLTKGENQ